MSPGLQKKIGFLAPVFPSFAYQLNKSAHTCTLLGRENSWKRNLNWQGVVAYACNLSTSWEVEAGGSRPVWGIYEDLIRNKVREEEGKETEREGGRQASSHLNGTSAYWTSKHVKNQSKHRELAAGSREEERSHCCVILHHWSSQRQLLNSVPFVQG